MTAPEIWLREAEDLSPVGFFGTMSGIGGPRATQHVTVSPSGFVVKNGVRTREQWFDRMVDVLTSKESEPHFLADPLTDRVGQFGPCDKSARALAKGTLDYSHNKVGSVNIQVEWVANPDDFTRSWKPGPNIRALGRLFRSHGIEPRLIFRTATSAADRVNVVRPNRLLTSRDGGGCHWGHCHYGQGETHWDPNIDGPRFFAGLAPLPTPTPAPQPVPGAAQEDSMATFVRIDTTDKAVYAPVIILDDFQTARWVQTSAELTNIQRVISGTFGKTAPTVPVPNLNGLASRWVGPVPPMPAGHAPYPIPAGWLS